MRPASETHPAAFGRYRVVRPLGTGAMGAVFLARDEVLHRDVAIKSVLPFAARIEGFTDRFFNEARAVGKIGHPNVVPVFDLGEHDGVPFLVMEMAAGGSLRARLDRDGRLPSATVRTLGIQISLALAAAHARGILHRDVKPANILEAEPGVWKLADFGVAHVPDSSLTMMGQFLGSPAYSPPEALEEGRFSEASDVYGLAATLFESLTGASPHGGRGYETRLAHGDAETVTHQMPLRAVAPPGVASAILRGLVRSAALRPSATEFAQLLATADQASSIVGAAVAVAVQPLVAGRLHRGVIAPVAAVLAAVLLLGIVAAATVRDGPSSTAKATPSETSSDLEGPAGAGEKTPGFVRAAAPTRAEERQRRSHRDRDDDRDEDFDEDFDED